MFDKYCVGKTEIVPYEKTVTIIEKKAPTDEGIKLYEEIKDKAYKSITRSLGIKENIINFNAIEIEQPWNSFERLIYYNFLLNGKTFEGKIELEDILNEEEMILKFFEELGRQITDELIKISFQNGLLQKIIRVKQL